MDTQKKAIIEAEIIHVEEVYPLVFRMKLGGSAVIEEYKKAKAGQFMNVYLDDATKLLPRPISIADVSKDGVSIIFNCVGEGTLLLSQYNSGKKIKITSPLGNGYDLKDSYKGNNVVVIGGGIGIPPLLELSKRLLDRGAFVTAVLGFRDEPFLIDDARLYAQNIEIATDSGKKGIKGTVVDVMREKNISADYYFACGPKPMLQALNTYINGDCGARLIDDRFQMSLEERMGCGYGACVGCSVKIQDEMSCIKIKKVCCDGPVFFGSEVHWKW